MNDSKIEQLKQEWNDNYKDKDIDQINKANEERQSFLNQYLKEKKENFSLELDQYTNVKTDADTEYFTHWIERKTESCGKFRTTSSFAYGIYKVNPNNIKDEEEKKNAEGKYKALDENNKKSKKYLSKEEAEKYFKDKVLPKLKKLINYEDIDNIKPLDINYARKVAYMYNPDKLLAIYKKETLEAIAEFFEVKNVNFDSYKATEKIVTKIKEVFDIKDKSFEITQKLMHFLWANFGNQVSFESKNIIYYGAPGTGKTYTVFNSIKQKVLISSKNLNDVALFTQFHPSFSYEDFIEGLKPQIKDGATELKLTNGIFKEFCKKAMDTLKKERKDGKKDNELTNYYFVVDEINRAELSSVFGELLLCLEENKRVDFNKDGNLTDESMVIDTQYSYLIDNEKDAVITVDGKYKFGIPANLYFIGTMNDIDRSIDSFDLALRRRFLWERLDYDAEVIVNDEKFSSVDNIASYIKICDALNDYIADRLDLGKGYQIGHAYFMEVKVHNNNISSSAINNLFDKKLKPLIEEYLRGTYNNKEIENKLKEAQKIFKL